MKLGWQSLTLPENSSPTRDRTSVTTGSGSNKIVFPKMIGNWCGFLCRNVAWFHCSYSLGPTVQMTCCMAADLLNAMNPSFIWTRWNFYFYIYFISYSDWIHKIHDESFQMSLYQLHDSWNPEFQCRILKDPPIIPILNWINPIPRIDTYLFKTLSNIVLTSMPRPFWRSLSYRFTFKILKWLLTSSNQATWPAQINLVHLTILTILGEIPNLNSLASVASG